MSVSSLWIITGTGEVLIEKHWRRPQPRTLCDLFWEEVRKHPKRDDVPPIIPTSKFYLFNILRNDLFFLATVANETPPLFTIEFLHRIFDVFSDYFDGTVTESSLKKNFATCYQLLEELGDNGFPLITEPNALHSLIAPPSAGSRIMQFVSGKSSVSETIGAAAMSVIPWRKTGVKYAQNEIFFDIIEEIDCIIEKNGSIVRNDVRGTINCKCRMSGTPDLTLVFNDPRVIGDASFHPCVRYARFEREHVVSFVPPDGDFKLLTYRVPDAAHNSPLYLRPETRYSDGSGTVTFTLGQKPVPGRMFGGSSGGMGSSGAGAGAGAGGGVADTVAEDIFVEFRLPKVKAAEWNANVGVVQYQPKTNELIWRIGRYPKDKTPELRGNLTLPPGPPAVDNISAELHFAVGNTTTSGLAVRDLLLAEERYKYFKGVRSFLRTGRFVVRS